MNKLFLIVGFAMMFAAQCFVPARMIAEQERILKDGTAYKFKTMPIDPTDPLRGKYINLNFEINRGWTKDSVLAYQEDVYVYIKNDSAGFAKATQVSSTKLDLNQDFIKVRTNGQYGDTVRFNVPFNTFYMEESKAYPAERLVRQANRDSILNNCYGLVYIKNDRAVLDNVFINDQPIKDYVARHVKENTEQ